MCAFFFFFNDTATTEIYTLSLHDALPISERGILSGVARRAALLQERSHVRPGRRLLGGRRGARVHEGGNEKDRKSTRLNSSHANISYAVFCLKKKKTRPTLMFSS